MRDFVVTNNLPLQLPVEHGMYCAATVDYVHDDYFLLSNDGSIKVLDLANNYSQKMHSGFNISSIADDKSLCNWFSGAVVQETSKLVCISRCGCIATINLPFDPTSLECEGSVDGGIAAACWSPDFRFVLLATNNDTLICMTNNWEVVNEVPFPSRSNSTGVSISWRGDGEYFAIQSTDESDNVTRIRIYTKELELFNCSREVGEGDVAVLKGLSTTAVAYGPAGGLIAAPRYWRNKLQVVFVETNGLHHGEFDIQVRRRTSSLLFSDRCDRFLLIRSTVSGRSARCSGTMEPPPSWCSCSARPPPWFKSTREIIIIGI